MRRLVASALVAIVALLPLTSGCRRNEPQPREHQQPPVAKAGATDHVTTDPCPPADREGGQLAWIHDDYAGALACARTRHRPLVIDLWAPWCHTCLSMQTVVFPEPALASSADRFVFASLDTDKQQNAAAVAKLAVSAWPTFYVIGDDEKVLARFVGGASLAQFQQFLDDGLQAAAGGALPEADAHLLAADRALAGSDYATATRELTTALADGSASWPRLPDALVSLVMTQSKAGDVAACLNTGETAMTRTGHTAAASDFLVSVLGCAEQRKTAEPVRVAALRDKAIARWRELLADPAAQLSTDDRSDALASLREALDDAGKHDDARAVAETQRKLLDDAAAAATTPLARMTYNWHRAEVYTYLGRGLDIVPALEKSAAELPDEYDPPARIGWVYMQAKKWPEAGQWMDKALAKMYGPRKVRYLGYRADIAKGAGDVEDEKKFRWQQADLQAQVASWNKP